MGNESSNFENGPLKVGIVGGGVGGLGLARLLQVKGGADKFSVKVFEGQDGLVSRGGSLTLEGAIDVLKECGLEAELQKYALFWTKAVWESKEKELFSLDLSTPNKHVKPRCNVDRPAVQKMLFDSLDPAIVEFGKKVVSLDEKREEGVFLLFKDGSEAGPFDFVVGADGIHSKVVDAVSPVESENEKERYSGITLVGTRAPLNPANFSEEELQDPGSQVKFLFSDFQDDDGVTKGCRVLYRVGPSFADDGKVWEFAAIAYRTPVPHSFAFDSKASKEEMQKFLGSFKHHAIYEKLKDLIERSDVSDSYKWGIYNKFGSANHWRSPGGKIALLGDAAHAMSPFLGQGANSALLDALSLCNLLLVHPPRVALEKYVEERKPIVDVIMEGSETMGLLNTASGEAAKVRDEVLFKLVVAQAIRTKSAWWNPVALIARAYYGHLVSQFNQAEKLAE